MSELTTANDNLKETTNEESKPQPSIDNQENREKRK